MMHAFALANINEKPRPQQFTNEKYGVLFFVYVRSCVFALCVCARAFMAKIRRLLIFLVFLLLLLLLCYASHTLVRARRNNSLSNLLDALFVHYNVHKQSGFIVEDETFVYILMPACSSPSTITYPHTNSNLIYLAYSANCEQGNVSQC